MGNESAKQEEKDDKNQDQIAKDEIPPDTQPNNQNKEIQINSEEQSPNQIIIKEKHYENNEDGIHTKEDERRVEYRILKVNKENDENAEIVENIDYDENAEQIEENGEGDYEINQQEDLGNEGYQESGQYINENLYEKENQNMSNYPDDYAQKEKYSKIVINKSNSSNASYVNKNIKIINKDNSPHILINTGRQEGRYTSSYSDIPRFMSFQKSGIQGEGNINARLNVVKTDDASELIEIPKSEYGTYAGRETVFIGGGMETGEYQFKGQGIIITQKGTLEDNIVISEEEILKEINKRKNKPKKEKRKKYEILDKFYAITEYEGKPIIKREKIEQMEKQHEYSQQHKYSASAKGDSCGIINESGSNAQFQQMQFSKYRQQSYQQSESQNLEMNNSNEILNYSLKYKNLDPSIEPNDNFSKELLSKINSIRANPKSYINIIENAKKNIITDKKGRILYNAKIKIALSRGVQAFDEAINYLKNVNPSEKLIFNPYLLVELPKTENEIKYKDYMVYKVENMVNKGIIVRSFWRDIIRDPDLSLLLMIVDDTGEKSGMRRKDLLDSNMKYIGINSIEINGSFACYITLCNKE